MDCVLPSFLGLVDFASHKYISEALKLVYDTSMGSDEQTTVFCNDNKLLQCIRSHIQNESF